MPPGTPQGPSNRAERRKQAARLRHKPATDRMWNARQHEAMQKQVAQDARERRQAMKRKDKELAKRGAKAAEVGIGQSHLERRTSRYAKKEEK